MEFGKKMSGSASNLPPSPHDLLTISPRAVAFEGAAPAWAHESLARCPVVVVRRTEPGRGEVDVGVRGLHRAERIAATLPLPAIIQCARPEDFVERRAWLTAPRISDLPHFDALEALRGLLEPLAIAWGPTGAMGYELATQWPSLTVQSDLDIVLRAPTPMARSEAGALIAAFAALRVPVDAQLETGCGAVALVEWASSRGRVLLRTARGPRLVFDPWLAPEDSD